MNLQENTEYCLVNGDRVSFTLKKNHFNFGNYHWLSSQGRMYNEEGVYVLTTTNEGKRPHVPFRQFNVLCEVHPALPVEPQSVPPTHDMVVFNTFVGQPTKLFSVTDAQVVDEFSTLLTSGVTTRVHLRVESKLIRGTGPAVEAAIAISNLPKSAGISSVLRRHFFDVRGVDREALISGSKFNSNKEHREAQAMYVLFEAAFSLTDD